MIAADVEDPELKAMLEAFDRMPSVPGPDGRRFDLADPGVLAEVKAGWLRGGFEGDGLWPADADPGEILRRIVRDQTREDYRGIVEGTLEPTSAATDGKPAA